LEVDIIQDYSTMIEKIKRRFLYTRFKACGVSFSEGIILLVIDYSSPSNQDTISALSGSDKFQTARILNSLEERGLICRGVNPSNKREKLVCLQEEGEKVTRLLKAAMEEWEAVCFMNFSEEEIENLERILKKVADNVKMFEETSGKERIQEL